MSELGSMHSSHSSEIMLSNGTDEAKRKIVFCNFSADGCSLESGGRAGLTTKPAKFVRNLSDNREKKGEKVHDLAEKLCIEGD